MDTSSCYADGLGGDNTVDDPGGDTDDPGGGGTLKIGGSSAHTSKIVIADNGGTANGNCLVEGGDGSDFFTIQSNGNVAFENGKGINFAAHTASNSTTSVLNDYKEGTWTATVTDFNGTYSYQNGYYTKIGSLVHVDCIIIASGGTGTGSYLRIGTLPFTVTSASAYRAVGNIIGVTGVVTGGDQLQVQTNAGLNYVQVMRQQNNGAVVHLNRGSLNSGGWEFQMSITYRCDT